MTLDNAKYVAILLFIMYEAIPTDIPRFIDIVSIRPVIYLITNKINNGGYVGKSIDHTSRWRSYIPPFDNDSMYAIHDAIAKYGYDNFRFDIIQELSSEVWLNPAEIYWIAYLKGIGCKLYNETDGGDGISGYRHTEETKKLLSQQKLDLYAAGYKQPPRTPESLEALSLSMLGHKRNVGKIHPSDCEHCRILRERNLNNNPAKNGHSDETKKKMSDAHLGSQNAFALMTEEKVIELRKLAHEGVTNQKLCEIFGLQPTTVRGIKFGRSWAHLNDIAPPVINEGPGFEIKMTEEKVLELRKLSAEGKTARELSDMFDLNISTIRRIINRETWKHVP